MTGLVWLAAACSRQEDWAGPQTGSGDAPVEEPADDPIPSDWVPGASDVLPRVPDSAPYLGPVVHPDEASIHIARTADALAESQWLEVLDSTKVWRYGGSEHGLHQIVTIDLAGVAGRVPLDDLPSDVVATFPELPSRRAQVVDVTGDGVADAVMAPPGPRTEVALLVYEGGGEELPTPVHSRIVDPAEVLDWGVTGPGDLDGDGAPDLLLVGNEWEPASSSNEALVFGSPVPAGDLWTASASATLPSPYSANFAASRDAGDLDGDGDTDVAGLLHRRNGDGGYSYGAVITFTGEAADAGWPTAWLQPATDSGSNRVPLREPRVADMNRDGYDDLVVPAPW